MRLTQQEKDLFISLFFKDSTNIPKQLQTTTLKYEQLKQHKQNNAVLEAQRIEKLRELCKQYSFLEAQRIENVEKHVEKLVQNIIIQIEK